MQSDVEKILYSIDPEYRKCNTCGNYKTFDFFRPNDFICLECNPLSLDEKANNRWAKSLRDEIDAKILNALSQIFQPPK